MANFKPIAAILIGTGLTFGALTLPAQARDYYGERGRISWSQLTKKLEDRGYRIRELDMKDMGWKAEVIDRNGQRLKLRLDRRGEIIRQKYDD